MGVYEKNYADRDALGGFASDFAHFNDDILFGENRSNENIDIKTRCIITVISLMPQEIADNSLKCHLQNAKKFFGGRANQRLD